MNLGVCRGVLKFGLVDKSTGQTSQQVVNQKPEIWILSEVRSPKSTGQQVKSKTQKLKNSLLIQTNTNTHPQMVVDQRALFLQVY